MSIKVFAVLFVLVNCVACNLNKKKAPPKILENKKSTIERISKRGEEDMVDGLYNEAVGANDTLKKFESGIQDLQESKNDSLNVFGVFDEQNKKFYQSASGHAAGIGDSILKLKVKMLISASLTRYDSVTNKHDSLLKRITAQDASLKDLRNVLKIVYTLPLIGKYQEDNLPSSAPIEGFSGRQNELIKIADTLIKK